MNPIFIVASPSPEYPHFPAFAEAARKAAARFSGAECIALTDYDPVPSGWKRAPNLTGLNWSIRNAVHAGSWKQWTWAPYGPLRWAVIDQYCQEHSVSWPIYSIDWDQLVLSNVSEHFTKCRTDTVHLGCGYDDERSKSFAAPAVVNHPSVLRAFCSLAGTAYEEHMPCIYQDDGQLANRGDMFWWETVCRAYGISRISVSEIVDDALWDPNRVLGIGMFETDDLGGKKLYRTDGGYSFKRKDGGFVKSVSVHCFMSYKDQMVDIVNGL